MITPATMVILTLLNLCLISTPAMSSSAKAPKPDLHAGGLQPSSIPNDAITDVVLPGFHLTGAHIETDHLCTVVSYRVVSDNEIKMKIKGTRTIDDTEDQCSIHIRTAGGIASTWIVVELTDTQQQEQTARQKKAAKAKADAFISRSGKTWHLKFADGSSETYTSTGMNQDSMPTFTSGTSKAVKIAVANDNSVIIIEPNCIRSGKLVGSIVKDGQSQGDCSPSGSWEATIVR